MNSAFDAGKSAIETKAAAAEYIAVEASRLARLANGNDFPLLAYLIDMVVLEAWREASESEDDPVTRDDPFVNAGGA